MDKHVEPDTRNEVLTGLQPFIHQADDEKKGSSYGRNRRKMGRRSKASNIWRNADKESQPRRYCGLGVRTKWARPFVQEGVFRTKGAFVYVDEDDERNLPRGLRRRLLAALQLHSRTRPAFNCVDVADQIS